MIERTLVLIKPDGVQRALTSKILSRFEDAGLKIVGLKMVWVDKEFASKHYLENIAERHGQKVRDDMIDFIMGSPVVAIVLEGTHAIEVSRKMIGSTYPRTATPGTIRGDFACVGKEYANEKGLPVKNLIHGSEDAKDAEREIDLWFSEEEIHSYKSVHDEHLLR